MTGSRLLMAEQYCDGCGALKTERAYVSDSFETCYDWHCNLLKKDVGEEIGWNEHNIKAPDDCPLLAKKTPRDRLKDNYKAKNMKLMKENKERKII